MVSALDKSWIWVYNNIVIYLTKATYYKTVNCGLIVSEQLNTADHDSGGQFIDG